jgi:hypothetical protein
MSDWQFNLETANPSAKPGKQAGAGCLFLFALPFAGFGVFALAQAFREWNNGKLKDAAMIGLFGLVFSCVGFGLMIGARFGAKKIKQLAEQKALHPDQPWLWREDWAAGRVKWSGGQSAVMSWVFAVFWNIISIIITGVVVPREWDKGHYVVLLVLLFPLIGLAMLVTAVRNTLAWRRFGQCVFEMAAVPAALGGTLEGMIQTGTRLSLEHGLHLRLSCIRRTTTGTGKNRHTTEEILWQDEKVLKTDAGLPEPEPGHSGIPIHFQLPADQPESTAEIGDGIFWRLEAKAKMRGPDLQVTFDVPVFKIAGTQPAQADEPDPTAALEMPVEEIRRDEHSRIRVNDGPGGREFFFPAARNPGVALGVTLFTLILSAAVWFLIWVKALFVFPVVFGLVDVLFLLVCFTLWFKSSRVTIDSTNVTAVNHWLFFRRMRTVPAAEVADIQVKIGMTGGQQAYYNIELVTRAGDRIAVAGGIKSKPETEWLVGEMKKALR